MVTDSSAMVDEDGKFRRATTIQHSAAFGGLPFLRRTNYKQSKLAMLVRISSESLDKVLAESLKSGVGGQGDDEYISESISSSSSSESKGLSVSKFIESERQ